MGGIEAIWPGPSAALLESALASARQAGMASDQRMDAGLTRGGRNLAASIIRAVQDSAVGG